MKLSSPVPHRRIRIEIIPLIDIMFFLLAAFMMVSLQLDQARNLKVHLPPSAMARHEFQPDMINIAVDSAGAVWLEKRKMTPGELGRALQQRLQMNTNLPVYISGDENTKHGAMLGVLQIARAAGVQKVGFMVNDVQLPATP